MFIGFAYIICFPFVIALAALLAFGTKNLIQNRYPKKTDSTPTKKEVIPLGGKLFICFTLFFCSIPSCYQNSYRFNSGVDEFDRMPLMFPYELYYSGGPRAGHISTWNNLPRTQVAVHEFSMHEALIFGTGGPTGNWFILDMKHHQVVDYESEAEFLQAVEDHGISSELKLLPVQQHIDNHWGWNK